MRHPVGAGCGRTELGDEGSAPPVLDVKVLAREEFDVRLGQILWNDWLRRWSSFWPQEVVIGGLPTHHRPQPARKGRSGHVTKAAML